MAGDQPERGRAEPVEIAARFDMTRECFGSHVRRRAARLDAADRTREPEVDEHVCCLLRAGLAAQHVLRRDVGMDEAGGMDRRECTGDVGEQRPQRARRPRPCVRWLSVDPLGDEERRARRDVVDRLARATDLEHAGKRRVAKACELLELVEQGGLVGTGRHDLEGTERAVRDVGDLEHAAEGTATGDRDAPKSPVNRRFTCHRGCHPLHVNDIGTPCQPDWQARRRTPQVPSCYGASVPDDERTRRRLGDATRSRIADLASGWTVDPEPEPEPESTTEPDEPEPAEPPVRDTALELTPDTEPDEPVARPESARPRRKTQPPPPPGSNARRALEDAILSSTETPAPSVTKPAPTKTEDWRDDPLDDLFGKTKPAAGGPMILPKLPPAPRTKPPTAPPGARTKPPTAPPGVRGPKSPTKPPPLPPGARSKPVQIKSGPTETGTVEVMGAIGTTGPVDRAPEIEGTTDRGDATDIDVAASRSAVAGTGTGTGTDTDEPQPVPRGEFEPGGGGTMIERDKLRIAYEQSTIKRDAANALLGIPEQPQTVVKSPSVEVLLQETAEVLRNDPTKLEAPETSKFERGDPTLGPGDPTIASMGTLASTGTLRAQAALRRKRGIGGDVRYVVTVLFGVRKARQELAELEARQELRQQSRRRHLITLGRAAATLEGFDHPALGPARESLVAVEEERSRHTAGVSAADDELKRVRRDRETTQKEHAEELAKLDVELAETAKKLEPLEKQVAAIGKRADDLKQALRKLDNKIANTEMSQHQVAGARERAAIQADIATLKADRIAVQRDEPKLAAELDALNPRIAKLESRRAEIKKRKSEIDTSEIDDTRRCDELLAAIGAKRKVVDRAASDAEALRDKILFELGERLYVDHPSDLGPQLSPIDVIDVELGTGDRRQMELKEIISSVDRAKLFRGIAVIALAGLAVAAGVLLALGVF